MAEKKKQDWRDGPHGPLAQDRMDNFELATLRGEVEPAGPKIADDDPRLAKNKGRETS